MLTRDHQVVIDAKYVMEEYVSMLLKNKDEFVESPGRTNVALGGCYNTTTQARLLLYSYFTFRRKFYVCGC